ncbi:MAG: glycosyltransferase [Thermoproteota archaeon]|nr:glycosyltransferase [Thermoproteota archaeon]
MTIGVPAYNERERISSLLLALVNQVGDNVNEVVVNVSGSTDGTKEEVIKVAQRCRESLAVKLLSRGERMGKAAVLDQILAYAEGDVIVFIDADTLLGERCIDKITTPFLSNKNLGVVSGNVLSLNYGKGLFSFASRFQRELHHHVCEYLLRRNLPPKVNGTFFAVRKKLIKHLPHYVISDDEFISCWAQNQGYAVTYVPDAVVYTKDPTNLKDYIAKRKRIYEGHILIKRQLNHTVPTASVRLVLPSFLKLTSKYWRRMSHIIIMVFMEFICRVLAIFDVIRGKLPYFYRVESAKFAVKDYKAWIDS